MTRRPGLIEADRPTIPHWMCSKRLDRAANAETDRARSKTVSCLCDRAKLELEKRCGKHAHTASTSKPAITARVLRLRHAMSICIPIDATLRILPKMV